MKFIHIQVTSCCKLIVMQNCFIMDEKIIKDNKGYVLEGFTHLASSHRKLHNDRRKYEWKVIFSVITFYVLIVSAFYTGDIDFNNGPILMIIIPLIFAWLAIISIFFLRKLHIANSKNMRIAEYSERNINNLINDKEVDFIKLKDIRPEPNWWAFSWQITSIITFAAIASVLVILTLK